MFIFLMIFGGFFTIIGFLNIINDVDLTTSLAFLIIGIISLTLGVIFNYYKEKRTILKNGAKEIEEITKKYKNRYIEIEHSPETYLTYINLKDYPKSRNPYWEHDGIYESIILFVRRMYRTSHIAHGDPFIVDTIQFANLVRSEVPKDTFLDEEVFLATLNAYTTYYFTIDEDSIYNNILRDFDNDEILVSDIIFKMRQKYIKEFKESSFNEEKLPITPDLIQILTEVFAEKDITPSLSD